MNGINITFQIYQIVNDSNFVFMNSDYWKRNGKNVRLDEYKEVYSGEIEIDDIVATGDTLEKIYTIFNFDKPEDYRARSLSVSDIVVLHPVPGIRETYFVDSIGYKKLSALADSVYEFATTVLCKRSQATFLYEGVE